jgi:hypothetical protein
VPRSQKKRAARAAGSASAPAPAPRPAARAAAPPAADASDEPQPWSWRALLILSVLVGALQLPLAGLDMLRDGRRYGYLVYLVVTLAPLSPLGQLQLLLAYLIAMPVAMRLAGERRSMRMLETMSVGAVAVLMLAAFWQLVFQFGHNTVAEKGQVHAVTLVAGALADAAALVGAALAYPFLYRRFWMPRRRLRR